MGILRAALLVLVAGPLLADDQPLLILGPTTTFTPLPAPPEAGSVNTKRYDEWLQPSTSDGDEMLTTDAKQFTFQNSITQIAEPTAIQPGQSASTRPEGAGAWYVVFRKPARFPLLGFGECGIGLEQDAAVIYEGMAIRVQDKPDSEGDFTVRFVMEAPATEAVVRMQFVVKHCDQQVGTVTLPPIRCRPDRDALKSGRHVLWQVEQTGYSPLLHGIVTSCDNANYRIERRATAQFGSAPERQSTY